MPFGMGNIEACHLVWGNIGTYHLVWGKCRDISFGMGGNIGTYQCPYVPHTKWYVPMFPPIPNGRSLYSPYQMVCSYVPSHTKWYVPIFPIPNGVSLCSLPYISKAVSLGQEQKDQQSSKSSHCWSAMILLAKN